MKPKTEKCIYCSEAFDAARGEGDHIIPAQLGEFRGDVRFRRICPECNSRIGRSEQQLLQCGPESFFRHIVKPAAPSGRKRGRSRWRGALGARSPQFTMDEGDHNALVRPSRDNPEDASPVDQIVVRDGEGRQHYVRLFPRMRAEQLRERVKSKGIKKVPVAWLHCDEQKEQDYLDLIKKAWPKVRFEERPAREPGVHRVRVSAELTVTDHYFRAIAKIAFHYYLAHSRRGFRGDEPCFEHIRDFIMNGGNIDRFFATSGPTFLLPVGRRIGGFAATPANWCHALAADESSDVATAYVQLFVGPGSLPKPHYITLGSLPSEVVVPGYVWAHLYHYYRTQPSSGFAGHVESVNVTRLR